MTDSAKADEKYASRNRVLMRIGKCPKSNDYKVVLPEDTVRLRFAPGWPVYLVPSTKIA